MYSPRSVSTGSSSCASRNALRPISSVTMLLLLVTVRAPASRHSSSTIVRASAASRAQCTVAATLDDLGLERLQVEVEMGQGVVLDVAALVAQRLELGQALGGARAAGDPAGLDLGQRRLQRRVFQRRMGIVREGERGRLHQPRPSPMAGAVSSPASTSAT